ncbi:uncharacterized protein C12orf73 homolog isoform X1 [Mastomys coucha]|uniref:uncharacterized protein C12orf73 homolog isoform X1 n=1 Tax=Mastomys coucha TaxID=35658 RepID=UPI001262AAD1|nr:uncharacterized protein C12orf73 homolog isoform X1 [Mastomys coucha]
MAAPLRVRRLLPSPRAAALPLGVRTHHRIGAAGGRTALASAPPTLLHHRGESPAHFRPPPRRPAASPSRDAGQSNSVSFSGRPGPPLSLSGNVELGEDGERPADVSFCGL